MGQRIGQDRRTDRSTDRKRTGQTGMRVGGNRRDHGKAMGGHHTGADR